MLSQGLSVSPLLHLSNQTPGFWSHIAALSFFWSTSKSDRPRDCLGKNRLTQRCRLPSTNVHHPLKALKKWAVHRKHIFTFYPAALLLWGQGRLREALWLFGPLCIAKIQLLATEYAWTKFVKSLTALPNWGGFWQKLQKAYPWNKSQFFASFHASAPKHGCAMQF